MEIGIDSFASAGIHIDSGNATQSQHAMAELLERIEFTDQVGLDSFGIGEHYCKEFLDSAPSLILAAAAARTSQIRLSSAVTVLGTSDPVRVFQNFATLKLISKGHFDAQVGPTGAFLIGSPKEVAQKILRHSHDLGVLTE